MEQFSLASFIKICLMDTGSRISELRKKIESQGGYDYYNSFSRAVGAFIEDGNRDRADEILAEPRNDHERSNNMGCFEAFIAKFGTTRSLTAVTAKKSWTAPNAKFSINISPLFEIEKAGTRQVFATWALQKPDLSQKYGAVACYIMRQAFSGHPLANAGFYFYDLTGGKIYSERQVSNSTSRIFASDVRWLSHELAEML
ncbi:hypothetical protein [Rhodobacter capsulatus]|uniref:hypothetical protein n=1 Tax=Rhodobacter capsulatus TaxID=1061 RepID=UPI00402848D2